MEDEPVVPDVPVEPIPKRKRGRPPGSANKGSETLAPGELRDALASSMTRADVGKLPPATRANLLTRMEVRDQRPDPEGTIIRLNFIGAKDFVCENCGHKQSGKWNGVDQPLPPPVDGTGPPAGPPARPATPPAETSSRSKMPGGKGETCAAFADRLRGPAVVNPAVEDDPPPKPGPIFRVPSIDDDGPPEWRTPLFPKEEN